MIHLSVFWQSFCAKAFYFEPVEQSEDATKAKATEPLLNHVTKRISLTLKTFLQAMVLQLLTDSKKVQIFVQNEKVKPRVKGVLNLRPDFRLWSTFRL